MLALLVAQTLGSKAGYICICSGKAVPTQSSHCHGPHGAKCHDPAAVSGASHNDESSGDRENHTAVSEDVQMRLAEGATPMLVPQVLLAILPVLDISTPSQEAQGQSRYSVGIGDSPPVGVAVARTIVLLI
ncbi:MAG: hypothetical protein U0984_13155 [Prosthecobacter sp.]|nr:hypothetical protein [Prosthecobacter sp.]